MDWTSEGVVALIVLLLTNIVGWAFTIGIIWSKVASIQGELQEHKGLNPYRAHGNGPARSKEA